MINRPERKSAIAFAVSAEEKATVEHAASLLDISTSAFCRHTLIAEARKIVANRKRSDEH